MNPADECIYHKFRGSKYIFLVLYVNDMLLSTNDLNLLRDTKKFLSNNLVSRNNHRIRKRPKLSNLNLYFKSN